jgi:hypothetical protein
MIATGIIGITAGISIITITDRITLTGDIIKHKFCHLSKCHGEIINSAWMKNSHRDLSRED